ncbi:MAG: amidophosphoribosyltransferase, partial [Synergistaceae bacterium]|nr:amidophosphoribosyltransferase [Synergistaceae bacterium]
MSDEIHEECGVIGVYRSGDKQAAPLVYYGLYALQHRGQESAGIAANNNGIMELKKGLGLAGEVFRNETFESLPGNIAIGHVRYSTAGDGSVRSAQPLAASCRLGEIALAHNGNLINAESLREMLTDEGVIFHTSSDSESILNLICQHGSRGIEAGIKNAMSLIKGAYVLVITINDKLIGVRDPYGLHPLCIGKFHDDSGYILASET